MARIRPKLWNSKHSVSTSRDAKATVWPKWRTKKAKRKTFAATRGPKPDLRLKCSAILKSPLKRDKEAASSEFQTSIIDACRHQSLESTCKSITTESTKFELRKTAAMQIRMALKTSLRRSVVPAHLCQIGTTAVMVSALQRTRARR